MSIYVWYEACSNFQVMLLNYVIRAVLKRPTFHLAQGRQYHCKRWLLHHSLSLALLNSYIKSHGGGLLSLNRFGPCKSSSQDRFEKTYTRKNSLLTDG